jgi:RTX calcium-binding nonapeptide repeat (4 copies)
MTINLTDFANRYVVRSSERVNALGGNDILEVLPAIDGFVYCGDGNDRITGSTGNDVLFGDNGDDIILGGSGTDTLFGGTGSDFISGGGTANGAGGDYFYSHQFNVNDFGAPEKDEFHLKPSDAVQENQVHLRTDYLGGKGTNNVTTDSSHAKIFGFKSGDTLFLKYETDTYGIRYRNFGGAGDKLDTVIAYQGNIVAIVMDVSIDNSSIIGNASVNRL